ncbi:MAG: competence/damage-inducible protein A [candidate division Zixibacteria bacterium]|nr:competence/damage-inducible protein A [candidate division Zixibacteria bacterium]
MTVEIITIGDEVTTGHTVDTNSSTIARKLTDIGLQIKYKSSVGDVVESMEEVFRIALKRAEIVITTGGLGPTDDDLTKRAIVKVFKRNLIFHEEILEDMNRRYAARGIENPAINQNQALLPQGAIFFPNKTGSAVGICIQENGRIFISLPGVPREMEQILQDEVIPFLQKNMVKSFSTIIKLRTIGAPESKLAELIAPKLKIEPNVRLAYLPSYGGVDLRVIVTGDSQEETDKKAQTLIRHLEKGCGKYIYGRDTDTLEGIIGQLLKDNDKTLAVAESVTGGQLGMLITTVAGSSKYFLGGVIAYTNEVKMRESNVSETVINTNGAVSEECAIAMAVGARGRFNSDYALAVTGVAGPDSSEGQAVGTTFIALASSQPAYAKKFNFGTDRFQIRTRASYAALEILRREILDLKS